MPPPASQSQYRELVVLASSAGARLDKFLATVIPDLSRSQIQRLIQGQRVTIDGRPAKASTRVVAGQRVLLTIPPPEPVGLEPESIPLTILYEDDDLLVLDKPPGLVVHPAAGHPSGTLVNALLAHCPGMRVGGSQRPGILHRLDKDTSGLMVVAKHDAAYAHLAQQIGSKTVLKEYLALVRGHVTPEEGAIVAPIGRDPHQRKRMAVVETGRPAKTHFRVLETFAGYTLVAARLETGRTHQIRVHFAAIHHPVAGDPVYGGSSPELGLSRQFLHAHKLGFVLPRDGQYVQFVSPLPPDLTAALAALRGGES